MNKFIILFAVMFALGTIQFGFMVPKVQAAGAVGNSCGVIGNGGSFTLQNPLKVCSIADFVNSAVEIFTYLAILLAVLLLIWTGFKFIMARGNPEKLKEEGKRLGWIVTGIAIVIAARVLVSVVISTLEATGTVSPTIIQSANDANKY